ANRRDMSLPRFEIIGSTADDFTLQISNVTFDDIGDYECQVIRDGTALQYRTSLSVLILPSQPVINYGVSQLTVSNHNRSLTVLCECSDGYPAPKLTWHLDGKKLTNGVTSSSGSGRSVSSTLTLTPSKAGVVNGSVLECRATNEALTAMKDGPKERKSSVTFVVYEKTGQPVISADAGPVYRAGGRLLLTCQASPGIPLGKLVWHRRRRGEHHAIIISPSSDLRNGQLNNIIALPVSVEDHLAEFTCLAQNAAMEQPLEASTVIRVMFPPRSLEMKRAKDASFDHNQVLLSNGEQTSFQCFASAYFDNLMVAWLLDSAEVHRQSVPVGDTLQERNLLSTYSFVFTAAQHGKYLKCQVTNKYGYNLEISMHLFIYYPPESVALTTQDKIMENQTTELTCRAKGGNPLPGISWFFDHQRILENVTQTKNGQEVTSKLRMILTRRDCNKTIFCRANTMNIERGIRSNIIQLDVMFPAELLPIRLSTDRADPGGPKAGDQLEAVCDALGSNPRTIFFWYISHCKQRGGPDGSETCLRLLDDHERVRLTSVADELHWVSQAPRRGFDSRSRVRFRLTPEHHLASLYCETTNAAYYSTARRQVNATLMVRHRPYFQGLASPLTVTAGQKELLPLTVLANPPVQPGSLRVVRQRGDGGTSGSATAAGSGAVSYRDGGLLFNQPSLDDAGPYWIEARNEIGVGRSDFAVEVRAPARIVELEVLEADLRVPPSHYFFRQPLKSSLKIHGRLVASPLPPLSSEAGGSGGWVKWQLPGGGSLACYDPASDAYNFRCWPDASHQKSATLRLEVLRLSDSTTGEHRLEASNGLGGVASRALFLYPLGPPQVTAQQLRVAVQAGQNASLDCSLTGAPPVDVAWRRLGKDGKFADLAPESRVRQRHWNLTGDLARGVAVLTLTSVATPEDLGVYRCEATSPYGAASADINVTVTSPPEPPSRLRLVNVTTGLEGGRASALLTWRPGHNGGAPQTFIVSCRPADDQRQQFTTYDIVEPDSSGRDMLFRLPDLKPSTNYEITLATRNKLYPETTVTLPSVIFISIPFDPNSERPSRERKLDAYDEAGSRNLLVAGCGLAVLAVLALNLVCVLYLVRRRKLRSPSEASQSTPPSQQPPAAGPQLTTTPPLTTVAHLERGVPVHLCQHQHQQQHQPAKQQPHLHNEYVHQFQRHQQNEFRRQQPNQSLMQQPYGLSSVL
ncbi:hypothetical protein BOX15_Mlig000348g2, partial [Macrostomum lignano]